MNLTAREQKSLEGEIPKIPYNETEWRRIASATAINDAKKLLKKEKECIKSVSGCNDPDDLISLLEDGYASHLIARQKIMYIPEKDYNDLGGKEWFDLSKAEASKSVTFPEWIVNNGFREIYEKTISSIFPKIENSNYFKQLFGED